MKIWIQHDSESLDFVIAVAGGVKGGIYLDGTLLDDEPLAYVISCMEDQGCRPVCRTKAALAMKKNHGGLAILYGPAKRTKMKPDNKTLFLVPDETKNEHDNAVDKALKFLKECKVPSTL